VFNCIARFISLQTNKLLVKPTAKQEFLRVVKTDKF